MRWGGEGAHTHLNYWRRHTDEMCLSFDLANECQRNGVHSRIFQQHEPRAFEHIHLVYHQRCLHGGVVLRGLLEAGDGGVSQSHVLERDIHVRGLVRDCQAVRVVSCQVGRHVHGHEDFKTKETLMLLPHLHILPTLIFLKILVQHSSPAMWLLKHCLDECKLLSLA